MIDWREATECPFEKRSPEAKLWYEWKEFNEEVARHLREADEFEKRVTEKRELAHKYRHAIQRYGEAIDLLLYPAADHEG